LIPPFNSHGVLPPTPDNQPHLCGRGEVEARFVLDLGNPPWRRTLFDGWDLLRLSIAVIVP
jgi:hypothetical protein